jgi:hypothetical protein
MKSSKILFGLTVFAMAASAFAADETPSSPQSAVIFSENFDDVSNLPGFLQVNASSPGNSSFFQGNESVFAAHSGAANSYIAANFLSPANGAGFIDSYLISPVLTLNAASTLSFFTRTADAGFTDKLEVRFSSGSGSDISTFTTLLTTVGADGTFPSDGFQQFVATLPVTGTGRFAFRYFGDSSTADYIGIDTVSVTSAVPEPSTYAMMGLGLAALALARRKAKKAA